MYILILLLPLVGSISAGLLGRWLGYFGAPLLTLVLMGITLLLVLCGYYEIILMQSAVYLPLPFSWLTLGGVDLQFSFVIDELSISMMIPICIVSFLVHMYAIGYMSGDPHLQRFFSYLSLFTFFMLMMVSADNWLLLFVGWEGVGLVSYLLIGFWFTRLKAGQAALKAFLMNRVGDTGLFLAMALAVWLTGDLEFQSLLAILPYLHPNWNTLMGLLILTAVIAKSGQLGLHAWLPEAMEGWNNVVYSLSLGRGSMPLSPYQEEAITGLLLSDGHIDPLRSPHHNTRFSCTFKAPHLDFILWLKLEVLGSISTQRAPTSFPKEKPTQYWFGTYKLPYFTQLRGEWYDGNRKILPPHLYRKLTPVALAFWIMGDGYWDKNARTVYLCTENFSLQEIHLLERILRQKFGLVVSHVKRGDRGFRLRFSSRALNIRLLQSLVKDHLHPLMLYKVNLGLD